MTPTRTLLSLAASFALLAATPRLATADKTGPIEAEEARLLGTTPGARSGTLEGYQAAITVDPGGGRSHVSAMTRLQVTVATPLLRVRVNRRSDWDDQAEREHRLLVVKVGDPVFDKGWVVSGAPSDLVRAVVDAPMRAALMKAPDVRVTVEAQYVQIAVDRLLESPDDARALVGIGDLLVRHLREGVHAAPGTALSPEEQAKELAQLQATTRAQEKSNLVFAALMALVGSVVLGLVIRNARRRAARRV